jgi:hypothetical protein
MNITIKDFVNLLSQKDLSYGHARGWLEDQDERFCNNLLDRRTAARILHRYMKIELGITDLADVSAANVLADLYTCRVCVNDVAQIFVRGIMSSRQVERDGKLFEIFDMGGLVSKEEASTLMRAFAIFCSSSE